MGDDRPARGVRPVHVLPLCAEVATGLGARVVATMVLASLVPMRRIGRIDLAAVPR